MDGHTRTRTGALLGSIPFMAPEQRRDARAVRPATDVYALSVTLGWLLLGEAPEEPWTEEAAAQLRSVRAPEGLVQAFAAAGARRPEDRPADGAALLEVLRGCGVVPAPVPMPAGWEGVREEAPGGAVRGAAAPSGAHDPPTLAAQDPYKPNRGGVPTTPPGWRGRWVGGMSGFLVAGLLAGGLALSGNRAELGLKGAGSNLPDPPELPMCADAPTQWVDHVELGPEESVDADIADVDGDGLPDVLFANVMAESVSIWWGRKAGLPTERTDVKVGRVATVPAIADVDDDGNPDLVAGLYDDAAIGVVLGLGGRAFSAPATTTQEPPPFRVGLAGGGTGAWVLALQQLTDPMIYLRAPSTSLRERWGPQTRLLSVPSVEASRVIGGREASVWYAEGTALLRGAISENGLVQRTVRTELGQQVRAVLHDGTHRDAVIARLAGDTHDTFVRVSVTQPLCRVGIRSRDKLVHVLGDVDQDGVADLIETRTCERCSSNHVFVRGVR
jgi:hypothetical protein